MRLGCHLSFYRLQNDGERIKRTVKMSKRPASMKNDITHLAATGKWAKLPVGPEAPKPGPTLDTLVTAAPIDSSGFTPMSRKMRIPNMMVMA